LLDVFFPVVVLDLVGALRFVSHFYVELFRFVPRANLRGAPIFGASSTKT
jgi:hypothetical protein